MGFEFGSGRPSSRDLSEDITAILADCGGHLTLSEICDMMGEATTTINRNIAAMCDAGQVGIESRNGDIVVELTGYET
tara:strand:+ start:305 stop:538 length:234 start_codon:yes stop_codon:yes gene_type:complete